MMEWEEVLVSSWEQESFSHPGFTTDQQVIIIIHVSESEETMDGGALLKSTVQ